LLVIKIKKEIKKMRKVLVFFLAIFAANLAFSQALYKKNGTVQMFDDTQIPSVVLRPNTYAQLPVSSMPPPVGAVPYKPFYVDYVTNGNSLNQVWINGAFILTAVNYCDSTEATNAAAGASARCLYNYSTDGGVTWASPTGFELGNGAKTRFPDMQVVTVAGLETAIALARLYDPGTSTNRFSGVAQDVFLGAEAAALVRVHGPETGLGYFGDLRADGKFGGVFQSNDTIYYETYDPVTKAFSGKKFLYRTANTNTVGSSMLQASKTGNHMTAIFNFVNPDAPSIQRPQQYTTSTDNGVTWSPVGEVGANNIINGDSISPYWHEDITYKPGTNTPYVVFSTRDVFASYTTTVDQTRPWKIVMYTPGSAPVVVADRNNIPFLNDTNQFKRFLKQSINASILSHPTIGFSADGSSMYVAFSVCQVDTLLGYNFNDIYITRSVDNGATWSTPKNITNTPNVDEMYPTLERFKNGNNSAWIGYQVDEIPGSFTFTDAQIVSRTYQVLKNVTVGIYETVGTEIPSAFSLKQNFPNPFNPTTKIRFDLSKGANVSLKVFDVAGKQVAELLNNEFVTAGTKQVAFDAGKLSSGIYFYTLTAGNFTETKKMMLIK
jgi:hypothetical protein